MKFDLDEQSIIKANAQFWEQMLTMELEAVAAGEKACMNSGHLLGRVSLDGTWKGHIEVRIASDLAYEATAAMMMQPVDTVGEADALDATKEIANMLAGTIKSSLPRPCSMSVPESELEHGEFCDIRAANSLRVVFRHASGDLMVRILEEDCEFEEATDAHERELHAMLVN